MQILILTRQVFHWKDVIMQVWRLSTISRYHAREPCLPKFSMSTPQIWVCFEKFIHSLWTWCKGEYRSRKDGKLLAYGQKEFPSKLLDIRWATVVSRLKRKRTQTSTVKEPRSGRPHLMSQNEDRALHHLVRWMPFATIPILKRQWLPNKTSVNKNNEEPFEIRRTAVKESK